MNDQVDQTEQEFHKSCNSEKDPQKAAWRSETSEF